jgi:hypothetical protein
MKTIIALLTTTVLVAGATTAMAAEQGSDEAPGYALSLQAARGFSGAPAARGFSRAPAARGFGGAYASTRRPGVVHTWTINEPANGDFQLQGR